jgi:hypothetical protein
VTLNKDTKTLNEAMQYLKSAITNQKLIGGVKKETKIVLFHECSTPPAQREPNIRMANRTTSSSKSTTTTLESRITKLEDQQQEHAKLLKEIVEKL